MRPLLAAALLAALAPVPARAAPPVAAPPGADAARADVAAYERGAWRYQGSLGAADPRDDAGRRLLVSLTERPDGTLDGEALVLDPARRLLAASALAGRWQDTSCRFRLALAAGDTALDGTCTPSVLAGTLAHHPPPRGAILDLLAWWGGRTTRGEAWLAPGGDI